MRAKQFYFIRHALATNTSGAFHISMLDPKVVEEIDEALCETGRMQAAGLSGVVRRLGIQRIVSSTKRRAVQTARILSRHAAIPYRGQYDDLAEINFGKCKVSRSIFTRMLLSGQWPRLVRAPLHKGLLTTFSVYYFLQWYRGRTVGGESVAEIYQRVDRMLARLETLPESRIGVVGHAGWISCMALRTMGSGWNFWKLSRVSNCSLTRIDTDGNGNHRLVFFALRPAIVEKPAARAMKTPMTGLD